MQKTKIKRNMGYFKSSLVFVVFSLLHAVCQSGCPSSCKCVDYSVTCVSKDLEGIPSFESLTILPAIIDLSGNKLSLVDNDDFTFDNSYAVKEVYLNNSEILDIESDAFDELENLQELYLGENLLNSIPEDLIADLPDVILLDISSNYFSGDMPKIRSKSLEVLAIANSKVTNIPDDVLVALPNLKMLLLQQNNIKSLDPQVFDHILDDTFFVRLSYNVWECNCKTYELFEYLDQRRFIDSSEPYQCVNEESEYEDIYDKSRPKIACKSLQKKHLSPPSDESEKILLGSRSRDKSFSLVKEVEVHHEVPRDNQKEVFVKACVGDGILDMSVDIFGFSMNFVVFLIVIVSFLLGTLMGYLLNMVVEKSLKSRRLKASDSESKLLPILDG